MTRLWEVPDQYLDPEAFYASFRDMAQEARDARCDEEPDASPVVIPARIRAIMAKVNERMGSLEAGYRMRGGK